MVTRRIVTANNEQGQSYFRHDGPTPGVVDLGEFVDEEIWRDDPAINDPNCEADPAEADIFTLSPPLNGSIVRVFTFQPKTRKHLNPAAQMPSPQRFDAGTAMETARPGMHTTPTIDYGIVLSGHINLELDLGTVALEQGDIVVQRATAHAWRNVSEAPCTMLFVLISSPNYAAK